MSTEWRQMLIECLVLPVTWAKVQSPENCTLPWRDVSSVEKITNHSVFFATYESLSLRGFSKNFRKKVKADVSHNKGIWLSQSVFISIWKKIRQSDWNATRGELTLNMSFVCFQFHEVETVQLQCSSFVIEFNDKLKDVWAIAKREIWQTKDAIDAKMKVHR